MLISGLPSIPHVCFATYSLFENAQRPLVQARASDFASLKEPICRTTKVAQVGGWGETVLSKPVYISIGFQAGSQGELEVLFTI